MLPLNFMQQSAINFVALFVMSAQRYGQESEERSCSLHSRKRHRLHGPCGARAGQKADPLVRFGLPRSANQWFDRNVYRRPHSQTDPGQLKLLCESCRSCSSRNSSNSNSSSFQVFTLKYCYRLWSWVGLNSLRHWFAFVRTMPETLCHFVTLWRWPQRWLALSLKQFRPPMTSLTVGHLFSAPPSSRGPMAWRRCQTLKRLSAFGKFLGVIIDQGFGVQQQSFFFADRINFKKKVRYIVFVVQVSVEHSLVRSLKPKYWLTCRMTIPANSTALISWFFGSGTSSRTRWHGASEHCEKIRGTALHRYEFSAHVMIAINRFL